MSHEPTNTQDSAKPIGAGRRVLFRILATLTPLIVLGAVEAGLRWAGRFEPTAFWIPTEVAGELTPNPHYAERFVGKTLARMPRSVRVAEHPPSGTLRVVVFGESAALGDPEPAFGFARFLQAQLEARYTNRHVEVINTAITALNSHAIRDVARDSRRLGADFWVVYAGNNEVVGPYGPAGVASGNPPGLGVIRAGLAARSTALGQWIASQKSEAAGGLSMTQRWAGLEVFLDRQVPATDPRLATMRGVYEQNLRDVVRLGLGSGTQVILGTMAVNLMDCPPFGSARPSDTNSAAFRAWRTAFEAAQQADERVALAEAVAAWTNAVALRPEDAETRYRLGMARLNAGEFAAGRTDLEAARDLDTIRLRADSGVNDVVRRVASEMKGADGRLGFVDAERELRGTDADRPPGTDLFFEHVHLRPEGNHRLALLFAEKIAAAVGPGAGATNWLSYKACLDRLGWTPFADVRMWSQILGLTQRPPFSQQSNAELRHRFIDDRLADANTAARNTGLGSAVNRIEAKLTRHPDDWHLREQKARLLQAARRGSEATAEWKKIVELAPGHVVGWHQLGESLVQAGDRSGAIAAYNKALAIRPDFVEAYLGLGLALGETGKFDEAMKALDTVLRLSPGHLQARVNRGIVFLAQKRLDEAMTEWRQAAIDHPTATLPLVRMADLLSAQGALPLAADAYAEAVKRDPDNAPLVHRWAIALSKAGRAAESDAAFRKAIGLQPAFITARLDLGVSLAQRSRFAEAIVEFENILRQQPTNEVAKRYLGEAQRRLAQNGGN